ncbi:MAG: AmmeMemoRadiSam system protein B, partial [Planctomycetales bacterium]|nr:AmmeMemoRadiSam system protein B [Planctomycetales bacterium]
DMNHYANDAETRRVDTLALEAMESLDADQLYRTVREHKISMCGVLPACIVMDTLRRLGQLTTIERVAYGTSADASGDKSRVVGYAGMLIR